MQFIHEYQRLFNKGHEHMCDEYSGWRACDKCAVNRGRIELRATLSREWSISLWTGPDSAVDEVVDSDVLEVEESEIFCFACYEEHHHNEHLDSFGELAGRTDVRLK